MLLFPNPKEYENTKGQQATKKVLKMKYGL